MENSTHYKVDSTQVDDALAILQKEQEANMPSRWQKAFYVLLSICVYGFAAALFFGIIFVLRGGLLSEGLLSSIFLILFVVLGTISPLLMLIVLPLNVPLLRKLRYQVKLVRNLGLSQFFKAPWKAECKKRRLRNIMVLLVILFGLSAIVLHFIGMVIVVISLEREFELFEFLLISIVMLFDIIICLSFILFLLMRGYKRRLEVVGQLRSSLASYKDSAEVEGKRIDIPTEEYEQVAQIERSQILFEREKNIQASFREPKLPYYSVQKSRSLREALHQLNPTTRLAVEDQIDELMSDPEPKGVISDPKTNVFRLRVPETLVEIAFTVDHNENRMKVLSLQLIDEENSSSEPGGQENA